MSKKHFNNLTPAEDERLTLLIEECAKVIQAASKIQRHGYTLKHPATTDGPDNRAMLEAEMGDMQAVARLMIKAGDIQILNIAKSADLKAEKIKPYLHHQ